ncbi:6-bladed beta-propeller [Candidatus Palauibacter sp.]|uniref:6-bladed beta-propeller n=1 Tax=Candidatus Palauibacter sp. TaxID=3101350 RepID=UPI003D0C667E
MIKVVLPAVAVLAAAANLPAQERRDTLVEVSRLAVPDSVPLTYIEQLVPVADGSIYMLDARTEGVLAFGPDGAFRQQIGRRGEGPGELLSPWRLGLLGRDTLWVADARRRVNLYDASTGESLADFGLATWDAATAGGEIVRPFAALANHSIMAFRWAERDVLAEVLAFRVERGAPPEGASLALLDLRDRSVAAPVPTGDGSLQLRNPFSHSDMIVVGPSGRRVAVIRRPRPEGSPAFFVAERHDVLHGIVDTVQVSYEPRRLDAGEIRAWAEELGPVERMVELGVFPSRASGVEAVLEALDAPGHHPPVENRGRGIVDEGVLMDREGGMWFQLYNPSGGSNEWIVVSGEGGAGDVSHVAAPEGSRVLAVSRDRVWAEVRDAFGVPAVQVLRVQRADG